jgi:hypothetical protein
VAVGARTLVDARAREALGHALAALGPYREDVVVVGGVAVAIYAEHPDFRGVADLGALATNDIDLLVPHPLAVRAGRTLDATIRSAACEPETGILGTNGYRLTDPAAHGAVIELLSGTDGIGLGQPQPDVLTHRPSEAVLVSAAPWVIATPVGRIAVPHPVGYAAQKLLMRDRRPLHKRGKDLVDALVVLGGFQAWWPRWWPAAGHSPSDPAWHEACRRARDTLRYLFRPGGSGPAQVAMAYADAGRGGTARVIAEIAGAMAGRIIAAWSREPAEGTPPAGT